MKRLTNFKNNARVIEGCYYIVAFDDTTDGWTLGYGYNNENAVKRMSFPSTQFSHPVYNTEASVHSDLKTVLTHRIVSNASSAIIYQFSRSDDITPIAYLNNRVEMLNWLKEH